jgi:transcriptional regulator with XRE-family HTH domain
MEGKSLADLRRERPVDNAAFEKAYRSIQLELPLSTLRQESGITQVEMAQRLGVSQAAISKFEGRGDFLCSTLFNYVQKIGAELEVKINLRNKKYDLVAKSYGDDLFFNLTECAAAVEAVVHTATVKAAKASENIIYFKDFVANNGKRRKPPAQSPWVEHQMREGEFEIADVLLNIAGKNENQSATA